MKQIALAFIALISSALSSSAQVYQDFEPIFTLGTLINKCWQFKGASLPDNPIDGSRSLGLNPSTVGGPALVKTPFINLNTTSTIRFNYKISDTVRDGTTVALNVYLQSNDSINTALGSVILSKSNTNLFTFSIPSPLQGTQRVVIETMSTGNAPVIIYLDNILIDGSINNNSPYRCKEKDEGPASIHYLKNFGGLLAANKVQLQWSVAENINNNYFEVERSADGIHFKSIGLVWASQKPAEETYHFSDPVQAIGYYRLKVVGRNNANMFSNILVFKGPAAASVNLTLLQNPVRHNLSFSFTSPNKCTAQLIVHDLSGHPVFRTTVQAQKGYNVFTILPEKQFKKGFYLLELVHDTQRSTAKFWKE